MNFIQSSEVFAADLENEVCIFNPSNGEYINLNKTASKIWHFIKEENNVETILKKLTSTFSGKEEYIKNDLYEFLEKGTKNGFILQIN